jgi:hypothetical protein
MTDKVVEIAVDGFSYVLPYPQSAEFPSVDLVVGY